MNVSIKWPKWPTYGFVHDIISKEGITWWARQGELPKAMNARANEGYVARSASRVESARVGIVLRGLSMFLERNIGGPARVNCRRQ